MNKKLLFFNTIMKLTILGSLLIFLLALIAFYFGVGNRLQSLGRASVSQRSGDMQPTPSIFLPLILRSDQLFEWREYVNMVDRYAIKYPPNWYLNEASSIITSYDPRKALENHELSSDNLKIWIVVDRGGHGVSTTSWLEKRAKDDIDTVTQEQQHVEFGNTRGILQKNYRASDPTQTMTSIYFSHGNDIYQIYAYPQDTKHFDTLMKIVSTIRFID